MSTVPRAWRGKRIRSEPRELAAIKLILAIHAKGGKRPHDQAVSGNRLETIGADAVLAIVNSRKCFVDLLKLAHDVVLNSALDHGVV